MRVVSSFEKFGVGVGKGTALGRRACVVYVGGEKVVAKARPFVLSSHASSAEVRARRIQSLFSPL
jgi:hypothetical protein